MNIQFGAQRAIQNLNLPDGVSPQKYYTAVSALLDGPMLNRLADSTSDDIFVYVEEEPHGIGNQIRVAVERPEANMPEELKLTANQPVAQFLPDLLMDWDFRRVCRSLIGDAIAETADKLEAFDAVRAQEQKKRMAAGELGFAQVAGMQDIKDRFIEEIIHPTMHPELCAQVRAGIPNATLLMGPPGNGKTYIAQRLAEEMGLPFESLSLKEIGSQYKDATVLNIHKMFDDLEAKAPCVVLMDEIDSLLSERSEMSGTLSGSKRDEVNALLERLNNIGDKGVIVLMATNNPDALDAAGTRTGRVDNTWYVGVPDEEGRKAALTLHMKDRNSEAIDYDVLVAKTQYYTHSDLKAVVEKAARLALHAAIEAKSDTAAITMTEFEQALKLIPPSMTKEKEKEYRLAADRLAGAPQTSTRLGFTANI